MAITFKGEPHDFALDCHTAEFEKQRGIVGHRTSCPPRWGRRKERSLEVTARTFEDSADQFAVWNAKSLPRRTDSRRVAIAHQDKVISESLSLLLRLRGFQVMHAQELHLLRSLMSRWNPAALIFDTRLDANSGFEYVRALAQRSGRALMLIALSNHAIPENINTLRAAGFDAHCRRPAATWRVVDMLEDVFNSAN